MAVNGVSNSKAAIQNDCLMRLFDADAELKAISSELDSFDGKKDPNRCNLLVNQLRTAQDKVISLLFQLMDECNCERASRDYRMKFPDEILLSEGSESLNGQIWFGAECLSAGSNILNHTKESITLRPMAKNLTTHLDSLRNELRELVIDGGGAARIGHSLIKRMVAFDRIFATFEYEYVRTMLPIRTVAEIERLQEVAVLFSETLIDCVKRGLIRQDDIDEFEPIVMIAIPRLAIVRGLLYKSDNAIYTKHKINMCGLFQPFHGALHSIRKLLRSLSRQELFSLEKMLANDPSAIEGCSTLMKPEDSNTSQGVCDDMQPSTEKAFSSDNYHDESVAGTSNGASSALVNGLQYPVGKKRSSQDSSISAFCDRNSPPDQLNSDHNRGDCPPEVAASSSKSDSSPIAGTSPSTSSSSSSGPSSSSKSDSRASGNAGVTEHQSDSNNDMTRHNSNNDFSGTQDGDACQLERLETELHATPSSQEHTGTSESNNSDVAVVAGNTVKNASRDGEVATVGKSSKAMRASRRAAAESELDLEEMILVQRLLHRLFVSIAGVADQLQSNFASDLRFILKHIFNTEEAEAESDEEDRDSNNELSDSSIPIEQAIEAQEVANLIDLESGYSAGDTCGYDDDVHYAAVSASNQPSVAPYNNFTYLSSSSSQRDASSTGQHRSSTSSMYGPVASNPISNASNNSATHGSRTMTNQDVSEDILADLMRFARQTELIHGSRMSPNLPNFIEENRQRQQIMQQHIQNITRGTNGRSERSSHRSHRHGPSHSSESSSSHHHSSGERRSRHHHGGDGSSRSRRPRGPPVWVPDQLVVACSCCNVSFSLFRRRHHCRACGQIFCADCSKFTKNLNCWGYNGPVRVCEACFSQP